MKMTIKKVLSLVLAATIVFGTFAFGFENADWSEFAVLAEAEEPPRSYKEGYYTYSVDEDGNATIKDVDDNISGSITVPSTLGGYPVVAIGDWAFASCSGLYAVTIGDGVKKIGYYAFYCCGGLMNATIPDSVTSIEFRAFYNCAELSKLTIGKGVTNIADEAFMLCEKISLIYYTDTPEQWEKITVGLSNDNLNARVVFESNSEKPYYLPGTCGDNMIWTLYTDGELVISGTGKMTNWSSEANAPWYGDRSKIKKVTIESGVTSIGEYAFCECSVESVIIPYTVINIGNFAFSKCSYLTDLVLGSKVKKIGNNAFYYCTGLTTVTLPDGITHIGENAFNRCSNITTVVLATSITNVGKNAFANCKNIKRAEYPGTHEQWKKVYVGENNYYLTSNIIDVNSERPCYAPGTYGDNIVWTLYLDGELVINGTGELKKYTGAQPWEEKLNLVKTVTIKNGITTISDGIYFGNGNLTKVSFGNSVTYIGDFLDECENLEYISADPKNTAYSNDENGVLFNKDKTKLIKYPLGNGTTSYVIPDGVKYIGRYAFYGCDFESMVFSDSVTNIESYAFSRSDIKSLTLNSNITHIADCAFWLSAYNGINKVLYPGTKEQWETVSVGEDNETIFLNLTFECNSERPYYLSGTCGENVTYKLYTDGELVIEGSGDMSDYSADDSYYKTVSPWRSKCRRVKKVTIHNGVNSIGAFAFAGCQYLEVIVIPDSVTRIGEGAFLNCNDITDAYYCDSKAEWNEILIGEKNEYLKDATIHYDYDPTKVPITTKPATTEPTEVQSTTNPAETKPSATKPVTTKPSTATTKPSAESTTKPVTTKPVAIPSTTKPASTKPSTTKPATTKPVSAPTTKPVTTESSTAPVTQPSAEQKKLFEIRKPSQTEITYGDSIILHADFKGEIPQGAKVIWATDNANFKIVETTANGETCVVTPNANGETVFIATLVDADGNTLDSDTQTMTAKAGFFQKIIAFFKKLFGMTKIIPEMLK